MEPWEEIREIQGTLLIINPKIPKKNNWVFNTHLLLLRTVIFVTTGKFGNSTALYEAYLIVVEARPSYHWCHIWLLLLLFILLWTVSSLPILFCSSELYRETHKKIIGRKIISIKKKKHYTKRGQSKGKWSKKVKRWSEKEWQTERNPNLM